MCPNDGSVGTVAWRKLGEELSCTARNPSLAGWIIRIHTTVHCDLPRSGRQPGTYWKCPSCPPPPPSPPIQVAKSEKMGEGK